MPMAIITGSGGLIGSEPIRHFVDAGYEVIGLENDMRARFFGPDASTAHTTAAPQRCSRARSAADVDIRDADAVERLFASRRAEIGAGDPHRRPALTRLGRFRSADGLRRERERHAESARGDAQARAGRHVIFCSTNKVYGDLPTRYR